MLNTSIINHEMMLKTLFEHSYNSIAITDASLELPGPRFVYVNPAFTKKTGYTLEELSDKTPRILQGKETNQKLLKELKDKCLKGEFFQGSTVNYRKDGSKYNVEWNISPIKDEKGKITHYISIQKDITSELQYKTLLEEKVRIQEKELQMKDTILSQQSRLVIMGEMIDSIAHQWKQPLNIIKMNTDILRYDIEDNIIDEQYIKKFQDKVFNQINHMEETLNEFRSFLRPNKKEIFFSVRKMLNSIAHLLKDELLSHKIKLIVISHSDFDIKGFENEFKHVIINLVNNSKDAFIQNNINVREILIETSRENNMNLITVQDNAGGIPKSIIDKIFEANYTTRAKNDGTGMGLYMSKKILDKHSASISVKSNNDKTVFTIKV